MARGIGRLLAATLLALLGCSDSPAPAGALDSGQPGDLGGETLEAPDGATDAVADAGGPHWDSGGDAGGTPVDSVLDMADGLADAGPLDALPDGSRQDGDVSSGGDADAGPDLPKHADVQGPPDGGGDAGDDPYAVCGNCEPHSDIWCGEDGKEIWKCIYGAPFEYPMSGSKKCWHAKMLTTCTQGWCDGTTGCFCNPVPGTTCAPNMPYGVYPKTECKSDYAQLPELEWCALPGCFDGACLPPAPAPVRLFPRPFGAGVMSVKALGPNSVLVGGRSNGLFEYADGSWTEHSQWDMPQEFSVVDAFEDGTQVATSNGGFWHRPPGGLWTLTKFPTPGAGFPAEGPAAWAPSPDRMWAAMTHSYGVWSYSDGEAKQLPPPVVCKNGGFNDIWGTHPDRPILVGDGGCAHELIDGMWKVVAGLKSGNVSIYSIHGTPDGKVIMAVRGDTVLRKDGLGVWTPVLTLDPVPSYGIYAPGVRVFAPDDIWAWGYLSTWHFDGTEWTERNPNLMPVSPDDMLGRHISTLDCFAPDNCWIGGLTFVMHWDGTGWSHVAEEMAIFHEIPARIRSIYAPTPDVVFVGYAGGLTEPWLGWPGLSPLSVRRFQLVNYQVEQWDAWDLGQGAFSDDTRGLTGLWGTSATDVYASAAIPMHFDGTSWTPLDLPKDLLEDYSAVTLIGRGDDLWISLGRKVGKPYGLIAHRKTTGGPWDFTDLTPWIAPLRLAWNPVTEELYGSGWGAYRINTDGSIDWVTNGEGFNQRLAIDDEGTIVFMAQNQTRVIVSPYFGADENLFLDANLYDYMSIGYPRGLAANPNGRGFLVVGNEGMFKLGTPDVAKVTVPVDIHTHIKPFGYFSPASEVISWSPWGDVWGGAGSSLVVFPGALPP